MPIIDSSAFADNDTLPDFLHCDICIIGTGPAGITIARELSGTPLRVTVLESGGSERQEQTDALNDIESVGWPRIMDQWLVRNRVVGGSSATWTGRCAPFDEIDLQTRDWVPYSGWPIEIEDLVPYFDRSGSHLGLGSTSWFSDDRVWAAIGCRQPELAPDPDKLLTMFWQYSRDSAMPHGPVRLGRRLEADLGPNITLVTNATVLRINATPSGTAVQSLEFAARGGRRWSLPVSTIALCAGGIENPRLLLSSDNVMPQGLGNTKDLVGRFLMDHPRGQVARFPMENAKAVLSHFRQLRSCVGEPNFYHRGLRLSPAIQRSEQLLNCSIWVREHRGRHLRGKIDGEIIDGEINARPGLRTALSNAGLVVFDVKEHLTSRRGLPGKLHAVTLEAMCEQRPDPDSRLILSNRSDHLGMRIPRIDWRVSEDEARTIRRITELTVEHFYRVGLESPVLEDWVRDGAMIPRAIRDAAHPTGTTRMADDPARGVVNSQCQIHGIDGLFVGGSSVFPTASHCNPTQMIVALALRLADTLKDRAIAVSKVRIRSNSMVDVHGSTPR